MLVLISLFFMANLIVEVLSTNILLSEALKKWLKVLFWAVFILRKSLKVISII